MLSSDAFYLVWDSRRDAVLHEFVAVSEDAAIKEFCAWYNVLIPVRRWEKRAKARYFLVKVGLVIDGVKRRFRRPVFIYEDWEVQLSDLRFRMSDPPADASEEAECWAEYKRICDLDAARREKMKNYKLTRRVDDEVLAE